MTTSGQLLGLAAVTAFLCLGVYIEKCWKRARANRLRRDRVVVRQSNCRVVAKP